MTEIELKYGCNPHQTPAGVKVPEASGFRVLSGRPSYINFLDALGAWQLVRELKAATGKPAAASFKHTSPAGAAVAGSLSDTYKASQFLAGGELSPVANAYVRARGGDRMCSFGDVAAVSDVVDLSLARVLFDEVSDLIIAPGFEPDALELLKSKRQGGYLVFEIDPAYEAPEIETREVFGFEMRQKRNTAQITPALFAKAGDAAASLPPDVLETLLVATIALKYTQSNSVCVAYDGQVIGMGAGQQSRVHCTRLACDKADKWLLMQHPKTLRLQFKRRPAEARKGQHRRLLPAVGPALRHREGQARRRPRQRAHPHHGPGARRLGEGLRRHLPLVGRLHPVCRQPRPGGQDQRAVRRPGRRLAARRRGHRGGGAVRHDDGPHGAAAVLALSDPETRRPDTRTLPVSASASCVRSHRLSVLQDRLVLRPCQDSPQGCGFPCPPERTGTRLRSTAGVP